MNGQHGDNHFWFKKRKCVREGRSSEQKFHCFHGNTSIFIFPQETKATRSEEDCDKTQTEMIQERNGTEQIERTIAIAITIANMKHTNYHKFNRVWNGIGTTA